MPPVYKHYSQPDLNRQYNNRMQTPDFAVYLSGYETWSKDVENTVKFEKDISYGIHERERLDIYPGKDENSPVVVFIHGGYWRSFDKSSFRFVSSAFRSTGATVICINYPLAPSARIDQIVLSCEKALTWITEKYTGDVYLLGHSAGAHLAAMLLTREIGLKIKAMAGLSGIYNLVPIQKSELNDTLGMDEAMSLRNNPATLKPVHPVPIFLAVGAEETDEFKAQTMELSMVWDNVVVLEARQENHFSIVALNSSVFQQLVNQWNFR
jgi:arylformamidase